MSHKEDLKNLPSKSLDELQELIKKAQFLVKFKSGRANSPLDFIEEILLEASSRYVKPLPLSVLKRINPVGLGTKLRQIAEEVLDLANYLELNQQELVKLCSLVMEIAAANLETRGRAVDFRPLIYLITNVQLLIEEAFPGYISAGFLKDMF